MTIAEEGMEPDDLPCSRNARSQKALAQANGTSRRASGWAGEKSRAVEDHSAPIPEDIASELGGNIILSGAYCKGQHKPQPSSCRQTFSASC